MAEKGGSFIGGPTAAKLLVLVIAAVLLYWFASWLFGWGPYSPSRSARYEVPYSSTYPAPAQQSRSNPVKEQWLRNCAAENAPVTDSGGGRLNCYRPPSIETYIDGERVE